MNLLSYLPKIFTCFHNTSYGWRGFQRDMIAGLTVSIVALPLAMALAIASGTTPERGLYTAIIAGFLISLLGGSRFQIGGPTGAFVVIVFNVIQQYGYEGLVLATLMAGLILMVGGFLGAGTIIKYIPYPVVTGFTAGIAVVLFTGQIRALLGLDVDFLPVDFIARWQVYFKHFNTIHPITATLGITTLVIILLLQKFKIPLPSFLFAMTIGAVIVWYFNIPSETIGTKFGAIPRMLPLPHVPTFTVHRLVELFPSAFTIAFLAGIESLLSAMIADGMTGYRHRSNAELVAQGIGNIASVLFGGIPATGAVARTITNIRAGARTPLAGMLHAIFLLAFMWVLAPYVSWIPLASLAAVMMVVAWNMSEFKHVRYLLAAPKSDQAVLLITFTLTVLIDLTVAVQVGIVFAALLFMKRMNDVTEIQTGVSLLHDITGEHVMHTMPEGVEAFEINGPFFFSVANRLKDELAKIRNNPKIFILILRHVPAMDATGAHMLANFIAKCRQKGTTVILAGVHAQPLKVMQQMGLDKSIGNENMAPTVERAISRAKYLLNKAG